jgi:beta-lactamase regulating signal transducer with metallopeptidase domain
VSAALGVVFAAVLVVVASAAAATAGLLERLLARAPARVRATWPHAALVLSPIVLAGLACIALAVQNPFAACHCAVHGLHHPHLCLSHPAFGQPLVVPSACVLALWALVVAPRVVRLGREVLASERWARAAAGLPIEHVDGIAVRIADGAGYQAFTVGALAPVIVLGRPLWDALAPAERRAVVQHEHGHCERRDPLTLLALRLGDALCAGPLRGRLLGRWRAAAESACDRHAAYRLGDGASVAEALLGVERARGAAPSPALAAPTLAAFAGGDLERRVVALLDAGVADDRAEVLGNDLIAVAVLAFGAGLLTLLWPGDALHHAVETAAGLLVH